MAISNGDSTYLAFECNARHRRDFKHALLAMYLQTSPSGAEVADAVIAAFDAKDPEPRYVYGKDSEWFFAERQKRTDREMDALAREIYGLRPINAPEPQ